MRLKQIAAVCARHKRVLLYDVMDSEGTVNQWIGDGNACYPVYGLPYLVEENIYTMFDIPVKKQEKWFVSHLKEKIYGISFKDMSNDDRTVEQLEIAVKDKEAFMIALRTQDNQVIFIDAAYLRPIIHIMDEITFVERGIAGGGRYIVAMNGMMAAAVIMPRDPMLDGRFLEQLSDLVRLCRNTKSNGEGLAV